MSESARRYESNDQLSDDVTANPGGIGFAGFASVRGAKLLAAATAVWLQGAAAVIRRAILTQRASDSFGIRWI